MDENMPSKQYVVDSCVRPLQGLVGPLVRAIDVDRDDVGIP